VWHGSADRTVNPANANEIVKQWIDVHGLPSVPMSEGTLDGHPRQIWWNADGETVVESYTITDMAHGTPLGTADNDQRYGAAGAFLIEAGISSSYHIANFFGLTERIQAAKEAAPPASAAKQIIKKTPVIAPPSAPIPDISSAMLWPVIRRRDDDPAPPPNPRPRRGIDVGAVITRALTAAGLMK
jgi:hypothetical protein